MKLLGGAAIWAALPASGFSQAAGAAAATAPARVGPTAFYPFKIGNLDAWIVSDGCFTSPVDPIWDASTTKADAEGSLRAAFLPTDKVTLQFNVLVVKSGADVVLVDSGCGSLFGPAGGHFIANLRAAGLAPERVTAIVTSHAHGDHVGGLADWTTGQLTYPNAQLFISKAEIGFWTGAHPDLSGMKAGQEVRDQLTTVARQAFDKFGSRYARVEPGQKIVEGVELVAAPGHTPGHCAVLISSGNEQLLHIVDAAHHPALMIPHPEWSSGFDSDPGLAAKTRRTLFTRAAADRTRILGYHLPFPGLGHVKEQGKGFAWMPEPWGWA
jgi:glyoxylase-like metal-dependent hydrolase (beta-lactamase superfamily II)